jgi:hypothetical protein
MRTAKVLATAFIFAVLMAPLSFPQTPTNDSRTYPESIRGYKVEPAGVDLKASGNANGGEFAEALVRLGEPELARVTPLGVTLDIPIWISPVKKGGRVESLSFENMVVNGVNVSVDDYLGSFDLPKKEPLRLPRSLRIFVSTPELFGGALDEWIEQKERWRVTGQVYVFGRFRKYLMRFKRVIPIEVDMEIPNPLKQSDQPTK